MSVDGWTKFWTWVNENQLAATIIGGLVVVAVVGVVSRLPKIGPHVRTALKWIWSWRPVSARRHEHDLRNLSALTLDQAKVDARKLADKAVAAYFMPSLDEQADKIQRGKKFVIDKEANMRALAAGVTTLSQAASTVSPSAPPTPPPPEPRWMLSKLNKTATSNDWYLRVSNKVPGSVALNVRIDPIGPGTFILDDAAFWPDLGSRKGNIAYGDFRGKLKSTDAKNKFTLRITWLDHEHKPHELHFEVDGPAEWLPKGDDVPF